MDFFSGLAGMMLAGCIMIGAASGLLTLLTGRVMSVSGMIGSLLGGAEGVAATSIAFIGGIVSAPIIMTGLGVSPQQATETTWPFLAVGGLVLGVGARLGGATLGGAVAGMARRSSQSVGIFMAVLGGAAIGWYMRVVLAAGGAA
jgi:hypothetical protein